MSENKTRPCAGDVATYLAAVEPARRREDALRLDAIFRDATGWQPVLWGGSILGYGQYHYAYDSGREGDFLATGFAPRKSNLVVYIMPGYADFGPILARLGKHRLGKSCLYLNRLSDVDENVLAELIRAGLDDLGRRWPIAPS
ncbi:DUF1801 domain-containing protein [Mesobacterium pallidum]|uniref:DUF1801 domain-containing protein n=1 Tax=Mesobacterium pallidum TaxID=2872037 RepID=UPI001EE39C9A|nr:DUF1801 domain-containing protein [Mesobacterium pallidum]